MNYARCKAFHNLCRSLNLCPAANVSKSWLNNVTSYYIGVIIGFMMTKNFGLLVKFYWHIYHHSLETSINKVIKKIMGCTFYGFWSHYYIRYDDCLICITWISRSFEDWIEKIFSEKSQKKKNLVCVWLVAESAK